MTRSIVDAVNESSLTIERLDSNTNGIRVDVANLTDMTHSAANAVNQSYAEIGRLASSSDQIVRGMLTLNEIVKSLSCRDEDGVSSSSGMTVFVSHDTSLGEGVLSRRNIARKFKSGFEVEKTDVQSRRSSI